MSEKYSTEEKISYYKRKWLKEHIFGIILAFAVWLAAVIAAYLIGAEAFTGLVGGIVLVAEYIFIYNKMIIYVERRAFKEEHENKFE